MSITSTLCLVNDTLLMVDFDNLPSDSGQDHLPTSNYAGL
jgi:hypothetical protein